MDKNKKCKVPNGVYLVYLRSLRASASGRSK